LLALNSGDLRGKYLKQEAAYYQNGAPAPAVAVVKPPEVEAGSSATSAAGVEAAGSGEAATVPAAVVVKTAGPLTSEEVDKLYKAYAKNMGEFKSTIQPLLVNKCGNENCHGSSDHAGRFYLQKNLGDRATIAENFKAMDRYIDHGTFENSRLLAMATAKSDVHKTEKAPIVANENDSAYKLLKAFILKLPTTAELMWGTGR
jgi:hypothetical protein